MLAPLMRLEGKVAVITGGAAGIGFAYAKRFLAEGARVVVADIADPRPAVDKLETGGRALAVSTDVSDAASVRAMVAATLARFGRIDVLVNNAAVFATLKPQRFDEIPEAEWDRVMAVNVKGVWNCARAVAPAMRAQGGGRIVNVAARPVVAPVGGMAAYVAAKAGVAALTQALAAEVLREDILINAVLPSTIDTPANRKGMRDADHASWPKPAELARTILWLCSPDNTVTSGAVVPVYGNA